MAKVEISVHTEKEHPNAKKASATPFLWDRLRRRRRYSSNPSARLRLLLPLIIINVPVTLMFVPRLLPPPWLTAPAHAAQCCHHRHWSQSCQHFVTSETSVGSDRVSTNCTPVAISMLPRSCGSLSYLLGFCFSLDLPQVVSLLDTTRFNYRD